MSNKKILEIVVKDKATPVIKKVDKALKNTGKQAAKTSKTASKSVGSLNDSLSMLPAPISRIITGFKMLRVALISTGIGAIIVAAGALAGLFISATIKGAAFAKQMSGLKAVLGEKGTEGAMKALGQSAKELGASTQFTATEVAGLQTEYAKLGKTVPEILAATEATLDLAASLEVGLAEAATLAGSVVNSFGLKAIDTQRVVDVLAKSTSTSTLDFGLLTESLKMAAPIARATGKTIEETAGLLGVLADNGIKGSIAGTGLSKVMSELNKQGLTFKEAYDKVNGATNKLSTAQKLVGEIGAKSLLNLAGSVEAIDILTESLENSEGAAKAMAEIKLDNLEGDTTKLSSAWDGFLLTIEDGNGIFMDLSRFFVQMLTKIITKITSVSRTFSAFFAELNASSGFLDASGVAFDLYFLNLKTGFLALKNVISKIPLIGKAIDKKQLQNDIDAVKNTYIELTNKAIKIAKEAQERREQGTFSERMQARIKSSINADFLAKKEKQDEKSDAKAAEANEERLAKRKEAYEKYLSFRNKLEARQEDFEDKTEEQKLERQKQRDLKTLNSMKVSKTKKKEAELLIEKFYDDKFNELEAKRIETAKIASDKAFDVKKIANEKAVALQNKADAEEVKKQDKQWLMLQELQNSAQEQELLLLAMQFDAKDAFAKGNHELEVALAIERHNQIQEINDKFAKLDKEKLTEREEWEATSNEKKQELFVQAAQNTLSIIGDLAAMSQEKFENINRGIIEEQEVLNAKIIANDKLTEKQRQEQLAQVAISKNKLINENNKQAKKAFDLQKKVSIASAIIDTFMSAQAAFRSLAGIPVVGPVLGGIAAGAAVAGGLLNIQKIKNTKFEGAAAIPAPTATASPTGGGGGGGGGGGASTSPSQPPSFNVVGQSGFNQVAGALGSQPPVQAFVVAGAVTTQQQLNNATINQATF